MSELSDARELIIGGQCFKVDKEMLVKKSDFFRALFSENFKEGFQQKITIENIGAEEFSLLVKHCDSTHAEVAELESSRLIQLLHPAHLLLFEDLATACVRQLSAVVDDGGDVEACLDVVNAAVLLEITDLKTKSLHWAVDNFSRLTTQNISQLDAEILVQLVTNQDLYLERDCRILSVLEDWSHHTGSSISNPQIQRIIDCQVQLLREHLEYSGVNEELKQKLRKNILSLTYFQTGLQSGETVYQDLIPLFNTDVRQNLLYPCIIACRTAGNTSRIKQRDRTTFCYCFNPRRTDLREMFDLTETYSSSGDGSRVFPSGCRVVSDGPSFIISGGECGLGRSCWNQNILRYTFPRGHCQILAWISEPRRHHSAVILDGKYLYLLGGINMRRIKLETVVRINLNTGEETECAPLPSASFRIAATEFKGQLVTVIGDLVCIYSPVEDSWTQIRLSPETVPANLEFHSALTISSKIYLTSTYSRAIFSLEWLECDEPLKLESGELEHSKIMPPPMELEHRRVKLEPAGEFCREAQNPCVLGRRIFNFFGDEFSDERTVEVFDSNSGRSEILWTKDDPTLEFSAISNMSSFSVHRQY